MKIKRLRNQSKLKIASNPLLERIGKRLAMIERSVGFQPELVDQPSVLSHRLALSLRR